MTPELHCCYRIFYGEGHIDNKKVHVRGFVDDTIVIRWWEKAGWTYGVVDHAWWSNNVPYMTKVKR